MPIQILKYVRHQYHPVRFETLETKISSLIRSELLLHAKGSIALEIHADVPLLTDWLSRKIFTSPLFIVVHLIILVYETHTHLLAILCGVRLVI